MQLVITKWTNANYNSTCINLYPQFTTWQFNIHLTKTHQSNVYNALRHFAYKNKRSLGFFALFEGCWFKLSTWHWLGFKIRTAEYCEINPESIIRFFRLFNIARRARREPIYSTTDKSVLDCCVKRTISKRVYYRINSSSIMYW